MAEAERTGYSCEKITPTASASFSINLSKDNKLTANVYLVYVCEKKRYELPSKIKDGIAEVFNRLQNEESVEVKEKTL